MQRRLSLTAGSDLPGTGRKLAAGQAWRDVQGKAGKLVLKALAAVSSAPAKTLAAWFKRLFWTAGTRLAGRDQDRHFFSDVMQQKLERCARLALALAWPHQPEAEPG